MPKLTRPPAFQFYPDDFSSDGKVEALTTEEVGAYILLLCKAWREDPVGSVPDDDRVLSRWTRLPSDRWSECRSAVLSAFTKGSDGRWYQKRMCEEFEKLQILRKQRQDAAKVGAKERWKDKRLMPSAKQSHSKRIATAKQNDASSSSTSSSKKLPVSYDTGSLSPGFLGQGVTTVSTTAQPESQVLPRSEPQKPDPVPKPPTSVQRVIGHFQQAHLASIGDAVLIVRGKDHELAKQLLGTFPAERVCELIDRFFAAKDKFPSEAGYSFGVFFTQVNKLIARKKAEKDSDARPRFKYGF